MKNTYNKIFIIVLTLTSTTSLFAQPDFGDNVNDVDGIPLDAGLSILVAGAAVYGIKKLREYKGE